MADNFTYDLLLKCAVIGDSGVGKSCILRRFVENEYSSTWQPTIGVDLRIQDMELDGRMVKLQLWDTAGQERFRSLTWVSLRGVNGVILVYDITDRASYDNAIGLWLAEVQEKTGARQRGSSSGAADASAGGGAGASKAAGSSGQAGEEEGDGEEESGVVMMLVGNKSDLEAKRAVPYAEAKAFADSQSMPFLETSAKEATNVEMAFQLMAQEMRSRAARAALAKATGSKKQGPAAAGRTVDLSDKKGLLQRLKPPCCS